jgi:hypothetical protein
MLRWAQYRLIVFRIVIMSRLRLVRHVSLSVPDERYIRPPNLFLFWALKCLNPTLGSVLGEG